MDVLRTAVSMLGIFDPEASQLSDTANRARAAKLVAKIAPSSPASNGSGTEKILFREIRNLDMPRIFCTR